MGFLPNIGLERSRSCFVRVLKCDREPSDALVVYLLVDLGS